LIPYEDISIVIPAYNEGINIRKAIDSIRAFERAHQAFREIIVVNDGSQDHTKSIVMECEGVLLINKTTNQGKGDAVRDGMLQSKGDWALFLDADLSTPIEELDKFIPYIDENEVIIGSRNLQDSYKISDQPLYRRWMGRMFSYLVQWIVGLDIEDTQCGFKMMKRSAIDSIFPEMKVTGWAFDVELLMLAKQKSIPVKEVAIVWIDRTFTSKVQPIRTSLEMFRDLLRLRFGS
jgi:dolichyl-phosphate beta-glucosyltransferase